MLRKYTKFRLYFPAVLMAGLMAFTTSCGKNDASSTEGSSADSAPAGTEVTATTQSESEKELLLFKEEHKVDDAAITGSGFVKTFLTDNLTDKTVKDPIEAEDLIMEDSYIILLKFTPRSTNSGLTERLLTYTGDGWAILSNLQMAQLLLDKEEAAKYSKKLDAGSTVELSSDKLKELVEGN